MSTTRDNADFKRDTAQASVNSNNAVFTEQVKRLYGNGILSISSIVVIIILVWSSLRWVTDQPYLIDVWALYMAAVAASRLWLVLEFRRCFKSENALAWSHYFTASAAMASLGWASVSLFFLIVPSAPYQIVIVMVVLGILATAVPLLSVIWSTFAVSITPPTAALFSVILLWENEASLLLIGALTLYTVLIFRTARNNHETLIHTFSLQQERERLIAHLDGEILERKDAQRELELHQTQLEKLIDERTNELQQTNRKLTDEIKEREKTEVLIKEERAFLQLIIDGIADPIMVIGKNYEIQLMNNAAREYCPEGASAAQCRTCYQVSHHADQPCSSEDHPCPLEYILKTGEPTTVLHKHPVGNGSLKSFEICASPLLNKYSEITGIIQVSRDITDHLDIQEELRQKKTHLDHLAHHDILTNLPNRLLFKDRFEQALNKARRANSQLALLFIDLDKFKQINDNHGHAIGDIVLQTVARRLELQTREIDTLARLGGDEFTLIIESLEKVEHAALVANKLIAAIEQPFLIDQHELTITTSIGISLFPQDGEDAESLLRHADAAMYQAKKRGSNSFQFYTAEAL